MKQRKWRSRLLTGALTVAITVSYMPTFALAGESEELAKDNPEVVTENKDAGASEAIGNASKEKPSDSTESEESPEAKTSDKDEAQNSDSNQESSNDVQVQSEGENQNSKVATQASTDINTAEDLEKILMADKKSETQGKTYTLQQDITIDTHGYAMSYQSTPKRVFSGTLDGNGHTITVQKNENGPSASLFDNIENTSGNNAVIKDLTLTFEGDVEGATLASAIGTATIENVTVNFQNVLPLVSGSIAYADGLYGVTQAAKYAYVHNTKIHGGTIGSSEAPKSASSVLAAGICNYSNGNTSYMGYRNVEVQVDEILANTSGNGTVCAAGLLAGFRGNSGAGELDNVSVKVNKNVQATSSGSAEIYAVGGPFYSKAFNAVKVDVGGDILAGDENSHNGRVVMASGMGYQTNTERNADTNLKPTNSEDNSLAIKEKVVRDTKVKAQNIRAVANDIGAAFASGMCYCVGYDSQWNGASVDVKSIVAEEKSGRADGNATAAGFSTTAYIWDSNYNKGESPAAENCTVKADTIRSTSTNGGGYAMGFEMYSYSPKKGCSVDVDTIAAEGGNDSASAGMGYFFSNERGWPAEAQDGKEYDVAPAYDGCTVNAESITADSKDTVSASGFLVASFYAMGIGDVEDKFVVENNQVTIGKTLTARINGEKDGKDTALFLADNCITDDSGRTKIKNNTVKIPREDTEIISSEADGKDHVRFTALEYEERADKHTEWESGNKVIFEDGGYAVSCDHDGDNTLWAMEASDVKVSYDLNQGTVDDSDAADYETKILPLNSKLTLAKAPMRPGYTFKGWSDGTNTYQPGDEVTIEQALTLTAQWEKEEIVNPGGDDPSKPGEPTTPTDPTNPSDPSNPEIHPNNPGTITPAKGQTGKNENTSSKTTSGQNKSSNTVKTGDDSHLFLYGIVFVAALAGAILVIARKKRMN